MPKPIPPTYQTLDALTVDDDGAVTFLAAQPLSDKPGFDGYLVPFYVLSDRGSYFVPGALKKSAKERLKAAPHLYQHYTDEPIGRHTAAFEDEKGFRISVEINEATERGAELMSNLRFGVPLGLSIGFDPIADRSGTEADDAKLDRRLAPDYFKNIPINELRAITEARWWESSSVTFPALGSAKPDQIRSAHDPLGALADDLPALLAAIKAGSLTPEQTAALDQLVAAYQARSAAAATQHGTDETEARRRRDQLAAALAAHGRLLAEGIAA